jgi:hypothetical protein
MKASRRGILKAGVLGLAAGATPALAVAAKGPSVLVYDSRLPASRAFAATSAVATKIDVAHQDRTFWRTLRSARIDGTVTGMTGWSDLVIVRGLLEEQGKRLRGETRHGMLFRWEMG